MATVYALQFIAEAKTEQEAGELLVAMVEQDGCIGGRALPPSPGRRDLWEVQYFMFEAALPSYSPRGRPAPSDPLPDDARRVIIPLSQARSLGVNLYEVLHLTLKSCRHEDRGAQDWCCDCWNAGVDIRRAAEKARSFDQLGACEACHRRPATFDVGRPEEEVTKMCGACKRRAEKEHNRRMAASGAHHLALFGHVSYSKAQLLELAGAVPPEKQREAQPQPVVEQGRLF